MNIDDLGTMDGDMEGSGLIALIDADTISYASGCGAEYAEDLLPEDFYSKEEWAELLAHPQYDVEEHCIWRQNVDEAIASATERIMEIMLLTNTDSCELYFTHGKNFRYEVYDMYKGNRKGTRYPPDLDKVKDGLLKRFPGESSDGWEADDVVVMLKRTQPDKYVLCAVDKDVLNAVGGRHFNYYRSERYGIDMKWQATPHAFAARFHYLQSMMGDKGDNIPGCPGIGPKKAEKILEGLTDPKEMWEAVVKTFKSKKLTEVDALRDMRLVCMHQLTVDKEIVLWTPPV